MCQGHQGTALSHHGRRVYVCLCASVCLNMSLCSCEVGAVAKGMPWLRGASQPADSISLEVAAPSSFIRGDRPRRCLPAPLTGRNHANAANPPPAPIDPFLFLCVCFLRTVEVKRSCWMEGRSGSAGGHELYIDPICSQGSLGSLHP